MKKMVYIMLLLFLWMLLTSCAHRSVGNLFESEDKTYESIETTTVERDLYDTSESANNTTVQITVPSHSSTNLSADSNVRVERSMRMFPNEVTAFVGDRISIGLYHSPTDQRDVRVEYYVDDNSVIEFAYSEKDKEYIRNTNRCVVVALKPGTAKITAVGSYNGKKMIDSCIITVRDVSEEGT